MRGGVAVRRMRRRSLSIRQLRLVARKVYARRTLAFNHGSKQRF